MRFGSNIFTFDNCQNIHVLNLTLTLSILIISYLNDFCLQIFECLMIKIAIFDSDKDYLKIIHSYFEERGFLIDLYYNDKDIESLLISRFYDVMIINIKFNAFYICKKYRSFYHGKMLLISDYENDYNHIVALELGADDFLLNPLI